MLGMFVVDYAETREEDEGDGESEEMNDSLMLGTCIHRSSGVSVHGSVLSQLCKAQTGQ